jgi:DNA-binding IclR family transcriptional regulator
MPAAAGSELFLDRLHVVVSETSQTLDRGLRVLTLLADADRGLTINELSESLGVNRTVVYRLVATLESHQMARRNRSGRIQIGIAVLNLSRGVVPLLRDAAMPLLRELADRVGATAHLTLADGDEALAVAVVEPTWTDYHVAYRVGARHPLDKGAAGRAILLGRSPREGRVEYAATEGELQRGARGVASPVRGVPGVEASVGVVALGDLDIDAVAPKVAQAASEVARRLS